MLSSPYNEEHFDSVFAVIPWWASLPMYLETHLCVQGRHNTQWWGCWTKGECTLKIEGRHHTTLHTCSPRQPRWARLFPQHPCPRWISQDEKEKKSIQIAIKYKITRRDFISVWYLCEKNCNMHLRDPQKVLNKRKSCHVLGWKLVAWWKYPFSACWRC